MNKLRWWFEFTLFAMNVHIDAEIWKWFDSKVVEWQEIE